MKGCIPVKKILCMLFSLLLLLLFEGMGASRAFAGDTASKPVAESTGELHSKALPSGVELSKGNLLEQVVAIREDVLRVRASAEGALGEDASWAVLAEAHDHRAKVTPEDTDRTVGFRTTALRVQIDRVTLGMTVTDLAGNVLVKDAAGWPMEYHGTSYRIFKQMPEEEHYFGLGDKTGPFDRRNQCFSLWNTDHFKFQESDDPIYKSIPFFLTLNSGRSIGILLDSTWRSSFDFGQEERDVYSFGAEGGSPDYYILYGPDPKKVIEDYAWLTGTPPLPPLWAFGYQQSRYSYESEARVREVASRLRADKIPADAIYLDIDFQKRNWPFTVNTEKFPHFEQMVKDLSKQQFRLVAITDLHIADQPSSGYAPYDSGMSGDHFVKNADGSVFVGEVWPGPAVFPDFTQKRSRDWWGSLYKQFVGDGISGFWNDMNEPSVFKAPNKTMPDTVRHRIEEPGFRDRVANHLEIHNVYGMENSRATYEGLLKLEPNERPFVLTRASFAGGQRYAATWTGDNSSTWNHLRLTTPMLLSLGLSGFGLSGADVGGFVGTPDPGLLTKWMEIGSFQPIDRNHTNKGSGNKEPWVYGPEQEAIQRRYLENRYQLLPYLYTVAEEMSRTGLPILRPLFLEFPGAMKDDLPLDVGAGNQFMVGSAVVVAPPPFPEQPDDYQAYLPGKDWFDYWTGGRVPLGSFNEKLGLQQVQIHPTLETLPVYVRAGSILPMQPLVQSTAEKPDGPLALRIYPGSNCHGSLYADDGSSFDYRKGEYLRLQFSCKKSENGWTVNISAREGKFSPWWKAMELTLFGWDGGDAEVLLDGKGLPGTVRVDQQRHSVTVEIPVNEKGSSIEYRGKN